MYNTPTKRNNTGDSQGSNVLFRSVGIIIAITLAIFALKFANHRDGVAGFVSLLFAIFIFLYTLVKKKTAAGAWFTLFGVTLLAVVVLGIMEI